MGPGLLKMDTIKINSPKLASPAVVHWTTFKSELLGAARYYDIVPKEGAFTSLSGSQETVLFQLLRNGTADSEVSYLLFQDNEECKGSKAFTNCCKELEVAHKAHKMALFADLTNHVYDHEKHSSREGFDKWCGEVSTYANRLRTLKVDFEDLLIVSVLNLLPKTTEWQTHATSVMSNENLITLSSVLAACKTYHYSSEQYGSTKAIAFTTLPRNDQASTARSKNVIKPSCNRCGGAHKGSECRRTKDYTCSKCNKVGHFESFCRSTTDKKDNGTGPGFGRTAF
jgi:hypothetical protein